MVNEKWKIKMKNEKYMQLVNVISFTFDLQSDIYYLQLKSQTENKITIISIIH